MSEQNEPKEEGLGEQEVALAAQVADKQNANKQNTAILLGEASRLSPVTSDDAMKREMSRRSRRTFLVGGAMGHAALWHNSRRRAARSGASKFVHL